MHLVIVGSSSCLVASTAFAASWLVWLVGFPVRANAWCVSWFFGKFSLTLTKPDGIPFVVQNAAGPSNGPNLNVPTHAVLLPACFPAFCIPSNNNLLHLA
jgi:hypothetical protein